VLIDILPIFIIGYFLYFRKKYDKNNILVMLIFLSFMVFATNYTNYGLDIDIYRWLHKSIGIVLILGLLFHIYKNGIYILNNIITFFLGLFFVIILLSYIGNDIYMVHYKHYIINFIFLSSIVLFLYYKIDCMGKLEELLRFIVYISLILAIFSIIETIVTSQRSSLMYSNSNYLSYSIMLGFCIVLFSNYKYKILSMSLLTIAIIMGGSRSVEIPMVILFLLYIFKNYNKFNKKYFFIILFSIMITGTAFWSKIQVNQSPFLNNVRIELAYLGIKAFQDSPINGMGYFQFRTGFNKYIDSSIKDPEILTTDQIMTHSDFVKIYAELGILGILFLLFFFYKLYFQLKKLYSSNQEIYYVSLSLLIGSLTFSLFHNNITTFVFWFILFLPFITNNIYNKDGNTN